MTPFEALSPLLRHHIVNDLGWDALRPVQEACIHPILDGQNLVVVAPTAGGKTEAAFFPLLSRLAEGQRGVQLLYLSPIRALLNNQVDRLRRYFGWFGRTVGVWHGDTAASQRKRMRRDPPTCLMTTPESLESILCSTLSDPERMFAATTAVVIDELHAFAGSDRGWHMLAVLHRIGRLSGRDLQRIGLSATVGNLDSLLEWLSRGSSRAQQAIAPGGTRSDAEVMIDAVGSVENAAKVISRLHRGEKRLVFCDSRLQTERLAQALNALSVRTFVTHSSVSADGRQQAERAFADARDCVIVATSALELGIDVGDLDRVIQLDAPASVSSFLQRMGRTGRRGGRPNCLFLTTRDLHLVQAAAVVNLWREGFVETVCPPPSPLHLVVQQALALLLQSPLSGRSAWRAQVVAIGALWSLSATQVDAVLDTLESEAWVTLDGPMVQIGPRAEAELGRRHFMELLSVFETPPIFQVLHGQHEIGSVHAPSFWGPPGRGPRVLSLAGRAWKVNRVLFDKRRAYVEPIEAKGRSRWLGSGAPLAPRLAQAMRPVLAGRCRPDACLSRRATEALEGIAEAHEVIGSEDWVMHEVDGRARLWTFAGSQLNSLLEGALRARGESASADGLSVSLPSLDRPWTAAALAELLDEALGAAPLGQPTTEKFASALSAGARAALEEARHLPWDFRREPIRVLREA